MVLCYVQFIAKDNQHNPLGPTFLKVFPLVPRLPPAPHSLSRYKVRVIVIGTTRTFSGGSGWCLRWCAFIAFRWLCSETWSVGRLVCVEWAVLHYGHFMVWPLVDVHSQNLQILLLQIYNTKYNLLSLQQKGKYKLFLFSELIFHG